MQNKQAGLTSWQFHACNICSDLTERELYGYESHHIMFTEVSLTGSSWIKRMPAYGFFTSQLGARTAAS
jgi:hypothetical protein